MEKKTKEALEEEKKKKELEAKLPYCTTAPSAEQTRASADDEPCDDGTGGGNNTEDAE
ncbi:MAG: hypothetical protein WAL98_00880 [Desulfatiglandaceae bacterium]